jgi:hypothetical protein
MRRYHVITVRPSAPDDREVSIRVLRRLRPGLRTPEQVLLNSGADTDIITRTAAAILLRSLRRFRRRITREA